MKLWGALFLLAGAVLAIRQKQQEHRMRRTVLSDFISVFRRMEAEISAIRVPMPDLLASLSTYYKGNTKDFLCTVVNAHGEEFLEIWKTEANRLPITYEEKKVLEQVGYYLETSEDNICKALNLAANQLEHYLKEWDMHRSDEERKAAALYMSGAALLVILLI